MLTRIGFALLCLLPFHLMAQVTVANPAVCQEMRKLKAETLAWIDNDCGGIGCIDGYDLPNLKRQMDLAEREACGPALSPARQGMNITTPNNRPMPDTSNPMANRYSAGSNINSSGRTALDPDSPWANRVASGNSPAARSSGGSTNSNSPSSSAPSVSNPLQALSNYSNPPKNGSGASKSTQVDDYTGQPCAFFTKRPVTSQGGATSLNYHSDGQYVCKDERMYICERRKWRFAGQCSTYKGWENLQADKVENSFR